MTVHLDVWTVGTSAIGKALWHMAADPLLLRRVPGLEFTNPWAPVPDAGSPPPMPTCGSGLW